MPGSLVRSSIGTIALFTALLAAPARAEEPPATITACDEGENPPFTYFLRDNGRKTDRVTGYSAAFIRSLLARTGRDVRISLTVWRRCLGLVAQG